MAYRQQRSSRRSNYNPNPMMNNYSMPIPGQQQMLRKDEPMKQQYPQQQTQNVQNQNVQNPNVQIPNVQNQSVQNQNVQNVQNLQRPPMAPTPSPMEQVQNNVQAKNNVQMTPPAPPQSAPMVTSSTTTPASTPTPAVVPEKKADEDTEMQDNAANDGQMSGGEEESKKIRRKFIDGIRKKPSIRAKEKRIRQNRRLGKVLIPKNALMALHEVKGISISEFVLNARPCGGFTAEVTVNNIQYEGSGASKTAAKNTACEKALRDLIISKMLSKSKKVEPKPDTNVQPPPAESKPEGSEDVEMKPTEEPNEEEELPMINLASFALYKLFSEWENEGFEIPEFRPSAHAATNGGQAVPVEKPKKPPIVRNELPPNWETMHPAMLLCMMRPGVTYVDVGVTGTPPNTVQTVGLTVDEEYFLGQGRSKKAARKNVATKVCNKLFGTNFPTDF